MKRLALAAAMTVGLLAVAAPAAADVVTPAGACAGQLAWTGAGTTRTSTDLSPDEVVEIPRADQVAWTGRVVGPAAGTPREVAGRVALRLPPPLGSIDLADWSGSATDVERSGTYGYDLPAFLPAGVRFDLLASHDEAGQRHCSAAVALVITGGPSPLAWVALVVALVVAVGLALLGRAAAPPGGGRFVAGGLLGLVAGLFTGMALVLFGVVGLASPLVTILLLLGLLAGPLWIWVSGPGQFAGRAKTTA